VFQPLEEVESEVEPDSGAEAILAEELDPVEEAAVDEVVMPSNPSPAAEGALDRDALNDILSALKNDEPEAAVAPELAVDDGSGEALEAETEQPLETGVTDGLEDEVDVEEEAISQEQEPLAVENVSEENAPRPAIDLGPLIEAMAGMGKTSPEAAPRTAADEVVGEPEAAKEEGLAVDEEIDSIADLEPPAAAAEEVAPIAPVEAFDLSDLEPPTVAAEEVAPVGPVEAFDLSDLEPPTVAAEEVAPIAPVEAFDLSDLEPPAAAAEEVESVGPVEAFDLSDLEPPAADVEEVESVGNTAVSEEISEELEVDLDELEDTQETEPSVAEREGAGSRGVGFNMRGDDELLRIFQEIETEGHIDDEVDDEAEREPEVEQEKRIATATLAEIYTIQGLTQKAIETYRELLGQEPDNAFIRRKLEDLEKGSSRK